MSEFSERLNIALENSHKTQRELAIMLDVSPSAVNGWAKGTREPDVATIKKIVKILSCNADWLIGNDEALIRDAKKEQFIKNFELLNEKGQDALLDYSEYLISRPKNLKNKAPPDKGEAGNE